MADVGGLLDKLHLSQYVERFAKEKIDGEIFWLLDDDMLRDDLGISNRLHRLRILRAGGRHKVVTLPSEC